MIVSYRDRKTKRFSYGKYVKEFSGFARQAELRLERLEAATSLKDLAALPGNRFEALKGNGKANIASVLTINGGSALSGPMTRLARSMSRLSITIR